MKKQSFPAKILIRIIKIYRKYLSPLKRTPCCRFVPVCSEYALQAIEKYGAFKGGFMAFRRILKCRPFGKSGYDPVL